MDTEIEFASWFPILENLSDDSRSSGHYLSNKLFVFRVSSSSKPMLRNPSC